MAEPHSEAPIDWRRRVARRSILPLLITVAGLVVVMTAGDETQEIVGWGIVAVAVAVAISLVFLEVGYSEDRERAAEAARRDPEA